MIGILYVFHGSQKAEKNQAALGFIKQVQQKFSNAYSQEVAFLENHPDTIVAMLQRMIQQGVTKIVIVPVLLFAAKHALVDIPTEVAAVKQQHPECSFIQAETFGSKEGSRQVLLERFKQAALAHPDKELVGFLVAHGTKQTNEPQQVLEQIAKEIAQQITFPVNAVSLKGEKNYLEVMKHQLTEQQTPVIVPFFLFDGHLITIMKKKLQETFPEKKCIITPTLEFDPRILADLEKLVTEALKCIQ